MCNKKEVVMIPAGGSKVVGLLPPPPKNKEQLLSKRFWLQKFFAILLHTPSPNCKKYVHTINSVSLFIEFKFQWQSTTKAYILNNCISKVLKGTEPI